MPWAAAAIAAGSYLTARQQRKATQSAAAQQQQGIAVGTEQIERSAAEAQRTLAPLQQLFQPSVANLLQQQQMYGGAGQRGIQGLTALQGQPLQVEQFLNPAMGFQMQQGRQAIEQSAAARGGLLSGAALKDITQFGQGLAAQNYQQAFENAMRARQQQLGISGELAGLGRLGTGIAGQLFGVGAGAVGQQAQQQMSLGETLASLGMGSANVGARATAASPSPLTAAITSGLTAYGMGAGGGGGGGSSLAATDYGAQSTTGGFFSDEEMKEKIKSVTDDEIEEFLNALEEKSYEYKENAKEKGAPEGRKTGVMAQDVEKSKMGKQMVKHDMDGNKMLDVPQSVSALLATSANLNKRINKLEGKR